LHDYPPGNLLADGTTTYAYDALNRLTALGATSNSYTGDGVLVAQTTGGTTRSTQDLAAPLSQVLQAAGTNDLYGERTLGRGERREPHLVRDRRARLGAPDRRQRRAGHDQLRPVRHAAGRRAGTVRRHRRGKVRSSPPRRAVRPQVALHQRQAELVL
jgi:hypothetical protein